MEWDAECLQNFSNIIDWNVFFFFLVGRGRKRAYSLLLNEFSVLVISLGNPVRKAAAQSC